MTKSGRNDLCPCGSGLKYKKCCLLKQFNEKVEKKKKEKQDRDKVNLTIKEFEILYNSRQFDNCLKYINNAIKQNPENDYYYERLCYTLKAMGKFNEALEILEKRFINSLVIETKELTKHAELYLKTHIDTEFRMPENLFPITAWIEMKFLLIKAREYSTYYPPVEDPEMVRLMNEIIDSLNDYGFPADPVESYVARMDDLEDVIDGIIDYGPKSIPYILNLITDGTWINIFPPRILYKIQTPFAIKVLIDIAMMNLNFASNESVQYLINIGERSIFYIEQIIFENPEYDPLKLRLIEVLRDIGSEKAKEILLQLLKNKNAVIVDYAGGAFAKFKDPSYLPALIEAKERIKYGPEIFRTIRRLKRL